MALVLTGMVRGMRPVGGVVRDGERKGEEWKFLSMEIVDPRYGNTYSCQLRDKDVDFDKFVSKDGKAITSDLTGHKVKVTIVSMNAGEREIEDKNTKEVKTILQIRTQITNVRDLGLPDDDEA